MNMNSGINTEISATAQAVKDLVDKQMRAEHESAPVLFDFSSIRPSGASISGGFKPPGTSCL